MYYPTGLLALSVLIYLSTTANGARPFPTLKDIALSFESNVEVTDQVQKTTALVKEYYDFNKKTGRLDILAVGNKMSYYFDENEDQIFTVTDTSCVEDDGGVYETNLFEGWTSAKDPLYVGPSALILMAQGETVDYGGSESVRSILCDRYRLKTSKGLTIDYYFADVNWTMPFEDNNMIPVRITVTSDTELIDQIIDYLYFRPDFNDKSVFLPPPGLGCWGKSPIAKLPAIPEKYTFGAEGFNLLHDETAIDTDVKLYRLWYDSELKMARLDKYTEKGLTADMDDYNTGVQYHMHDYRTCRFRTLKNSLFVTFKTDSLVRRMKRPAEVLNLEGDFYSLGQAEIRGVKTQVFEKAEKDVSFGDNDYKLLVTTVYFTSKNTKSEVDGEDLDDSPPIDIRITGYGENEKVLLKMQFQIFAFDDEPGREFYSTYPVETCFPKTTQKSYFVIILEASPEVAAQVEAISPGFLDEARAVITNVANISDLRLPFLKADYSVSGIYLTGLMLDKPPSLAQFIKEFDEPQETGNIAAFVISPDADTAESCATACVEYSEPCKGFHFCGRGCFLSLGEIIDVPVSPIPLGLMCYVYLRAIADTRNDQSSLEQALQNLIDAKDRKELTFNPPLKQDQGVLPAVEVVVSSGNTKGSVNDYPYTLVKDGYQFKKTALTTIEIPDADSEEECYRQCKDSTTLPCESFSYCAKASNKMCRITSVFLGGGSKDNDEIEYNVQCDIFSLLYLDFFDRYPGRVFVISGNKNVPNVESAELCAKNCKDESGFTCRGFEFCKSKSSCVLHSKHVVDLKPGESVPAKSDCVHYSVRFSADYRYKGNMLIDYESNVRNEITMEECARACSEEVSNCNSFNYCPPTSVGMTDSTCAFTSKTLKDDVPSKKFENCRLYTRYTPDTPPTEETKKEGYTSKGFAGLLVGMIIFGIIVGALLFVGYSYYRSRAGGDGMTVRFTKQENI